MTTDDQSMLVNKTMSLWQAYRALGELVPIDDPAHHLLKRLNVEMDQLYVDVVRLCHVSHA